MIEINENKIRPVGDMILVKPVEQMSKSKGGIIIPEVAKDIPLLGEILAAGPGRRDERGKRFTLDVKEGDQVYYNRYAGSTIKTTGEKTVILMSADDVLAVVDK